MENKKVKINNLSGWSEINLGSLCQISRGGSPRPIQQFLTDSNNGYNWLRIGDVPVNGKYISKITAKIVKEGLKKTTLVKPGDFILSNSMSFGRPYIMKVDACIHDGWLALKNLDPSLIERDYLFYLLLSPKLQNDFRNYSAGSGVLNLKKETVEKVLVILPEIHEQNRIVAVLETWDQAIEKLKKKIEIKKNIKKGLMQELLTGKKRSRGFSDKWNKVKLGDYISKIEEYTKNHDEVAILTSSRAGLVLQSEYFKKQVTSANNSGYKIIHKGEFTYRAMSDSDIFSFNRLKIVDIGAVSPAYSVFQIKKINPDFVEFLMKTPWFIHQAYKYAQGGTRLSLKLENLKEIGISIPNMMEQDVIAKILTTADKEINALEKKLEIFQEQKRFLLNNLVTGNIRTPEDLKINR